MSEEQSTALTPVQMAQGTIEFRVEKSTALLARMGIAPQAFERVALNALMNNKRLRECVPASIDRALITCIEMGLLPDGREAAIVPLKDGQSGKLMANLWPMIEGKIKLARQASPGVALRVRVVYDGDHWRYSEGLLPVLEHQATATDRSDKKLIAAYAVAVLPGSSAPEFEVMDRLELDRRRAKSPSVRANKTKTPWFTDYAEMCKKTVLSQLLKRLPKRPGQPDVPDGLEVYEFEQPGDFVPELAMPPPPDESSASPAASQEAIEGEVVDGAPLPPEPDDDPPPRPPPPPAATSDGPPPEGDVDKRKSPF